MTVDETHAVAHAAELPAEVAEILPDAAEIPAEDPAPAPAEDPAPELPGAGEALTDEELERAVTALLFASPDPLSVRRIAELLDGPRQARVEAAVSALAERVARAGLPLVVKRIAGGWRMFTAPELSEVVARLGRARKAERISGAALETLSIIAYRQPVTKAEIEAIRGVQAGPVLRSLVDKGLVRVSGRADHPGAPLQYGTTREFLDRFGLPSLEELPRDGELVRD